MRDMLKSSSSGLDVDKMIAQMLCKQLMETDTDGEDFVNTVHRCCALLITIEGMCSFYVVWVCLQLMFWKISKGIRWFKYNNEESSDIGSIPSDAVRNQTSGITCATADTKCGRSHEEKGMTC